MAQNEWLVVFLIYADFRVSGFKNRKKTFDELENILSDFKDSQIKDNTRVVFAFNSIKFIATGSEAIKADFTYIYEIKKSTGSSKNIFSCIDIVDNQNYYAAGKPQIVDQLNAIFKKIKEHTGYSGEKIMLNTWDHGSVFGIFKEDDELEVIIEVVQNEAEYPLINELFSKTLPENPDKEIAGMSLKSYLNSVNEQDSNPVFYINQKFLTPNTSKDLGFREEFIKLYATGDLQRESILKIDENYFLQIDSTDATFTESASPSFIKILEDNGLKAENNILIPLKDVSPEILSNAELSQSISDRFTKVDVLVMMNCWMMNLDTLYSLRKSVNYIIAPPGDIDHPCYNYFEMINSFNNKLTPEEAAVLPIKTLLLINSAYRAEHIKNHENTCVVSMKTEHMDEICEAIDNFAGELINAFQELLKVPNPDFEFYQRLKHYLLFSRKLCPKLDSTGNYYIIDLWIWIKAILRNEDSDLSRKFTDIFVKINTKLTRKKSLHSIHFGKTFFTSRDTCTHRIMTKPTGLSIYFPYNESLLRKTQNNPIIKQSVSLTEKKNWLPLLRLLTS